MSVPIKPRVRELQGYGLRPPEDVRVKLDLNESPYDFPDDLKEAAWQVARSRAWSRYPDHPPQRLLDALAAHASWPAEGTLVGNGSNELIQAALTVSLEPGVPLLVPRPSFEVYRVLGTLLTPDVRFFDLGPDLAYDAASLEAELQRLPRGVVLLCSPNNPTGGTVTEAHVRQALDGPERLVLLDAAYAEFADLPLDGLLQHHPNLVVLRTFSKAWGLAGLRLGYLLAAPDLAREIGKAVLPFNVNVFSEACALVALAAAERLGATVRRIVEDRAALADGLAAIPGVTVYPSQANFILFEVPVPSGPVWKELQARGVAVRDVSRMPRLERALRVSVGTPEQNRAFLEALEDILASR